MKRYLIFMWARWEEPHGGAKDFVGDANTREEIKAIVLDNRYSIRMNLLDTKTKEIKQLDIGETYLEEEKLNKILKEIEE